MELRKILPFLFLLAAFFPLLLTSNSPDWTETRVIRMTPLLLEQTLAVSPTKKYVVVINSGLSEMMLVETDRDGTDETITTLLLERVPIDVCFTVDYSSGEDKLYFVWAEWVGSYCQIFTAEKNSSGFFVVQRTFDSYNHRAPKLQKVGDKIYYVWVGKVNGYWQIFTAEKNSSGFFVVQRTFDSYNNIHPNLLVSKQDGRIYYAWYNGSGTVYDLKLGYSNMDGSGWVSKSFDLDLYFFQSTHPQILIRQNKLYLAFAGGEYAKTGYLYRATVDKDLSNWQYEAIKPIGTTGAHAGPYCQEFKETIYWAWIEYVEHNGILYTARDFPNGTFGAITQRTSGVDADPNRNNTLFVLLKNEVHGNVEEHYSFRKRPIPYYEIYVAYTYLNKAPNFELINPSDGSTTNFAELTFALTDAEGDPLNLTVYWKDGTKAEEITLVPPDSVVEIKLNLARGAWHEYYIEVSDGLNTNNSFSLLQKYYKFYLNDYPSIIEVTPLSIKEGERGSFIVECTDDKDPLEELIVEILIFLTPDKKIRISLPYDNTIKKFKRSWYCNIPSKKYRVRVICRDSDGFEQSQDFELVVLEAKTIAPSPSPSIPAIIFFVGLIGALLKKR